MIITSDHDDIECHYN